MILRNRILLYLFKNVQAKSKVKIIPEISWKIHVNQLRGAFKIKKRRNLGKFPKWRWPPRPLPDLGLFWTWELFEMEWPPLNGTWDFFELGNILRQNDPLQNLKNNLKMGTFETKSITICKISVLFAIFKAKKYKFFCLRVLMRWK